MYTLILIHYISKDEPNLPYKYMYVCIYIHQNLTNNEIGGIGTEYRHWRLPLMHLHTYICMYVHTDGNSLLFTRNKFQCRIHTYVCMNMHAYIALTNN